ncbi:phosphopantetheine-binding protein [Streptomyces sp. ICN988]|uniref:beta-ketoacyl synthase N-terminal-like domain-containing protein n=1 Tax=Streptomyces sp. ICN988 TaxID=2983765 RepID=UPI0021E4796D|nr:beta-ketoacyl synthase N-terminal-like domain-containing protein [Streptomyces sp. ICN988]MCV2458432.1 phosphopantetheine-binding protein [Streptomyces sp. ICN988]
MTAVSRQTVRSYVREVIAEVAGVSPAALTAPDALRGMNMPSLMRMNVTLRFEQDLGEMPPMLMFEHHTVDALTDYFLSAHQARLSDVLPDERLSRRSDASQSAQLPTDLLARGNEDIAVVAVTGRYPGAPDIETLWSNLQGGVTSITEVPEDRWDWRKHFDNRRGRLNSSYGKWGGFLDGVADFDAEFFGILPSDAAVMDPQERLFLLACWDLLEQAGGLGRTTHEPSTGVYVGTMNSTYGKLGATEWHLGKMVGANSAPWSIANRVSYVFDFHGPSFAVDSACSSSLTAIHLACESLRRGECAAAIAGGVNLILHPAHLVGLSAAGMLSSDGSCKVFDAAADGYIPGEGVGAVLLKPLSAALTDGDRVWGVIKGSALNTAGRTSGFTVPDPTVQSDLVTAALRQAGLKPHEISYVEAHGTGTELGDPLEIEALARSLKPGREENRPCVVGSLKGNIGHLEGAAGIAGLTKILLQLEHRQIAPCATLHTLNPKIRAVSAGRLRFPDSLTPWQPDKAGGGVLRAGLSSFGAGGANAHLVVEEPPVRSRATVTPSADRGGVDTEHAVLLSARTAQQLRTLAASVSSMLNREPVDGDPEQYLRRLSYTTQVGRREMLHRFAVCCTTVDQLREVLADFGKSGSEDGGVRGQASDGDQYGEGEDEAYLEALIGKRRIGRLARVWAEGAPVDWSRLWDDPQPSRVRMPPYPFDMKQYWAPSGPVPSGAASGQKSMVPPPGSSEPLTVSNDSMQPAGETPANQGPVEWTLRMIACGFLLVDPSEVDIHTDLMKLGFDSITLVQLTTEIEETYGVGLEPTIVFDHPTLKAIASHLLHDHPRAVTAQHDHDDEPPAEPDEGAVG